MTNANCIKYIQSTIICILIQESSLLTEYNNTNRLSRKLNDIYTVTASLIAPHTYFVRDSIYVEITIHTRYGTYSGRELCKSYPQLECRRNPLNQQKRHHAK